MWQGRGRSGQSESHDFGPGALSRAIAAFSPPPHNQLLSKEAQLQRNTTLRLGYVDGTPSGYRMLLAAITMVFILSLLHRNDAW